MDDIMPEERPKIPSDMVSEPKKSAVPPAGKQPLQNRNDKMNFLYRKKPADHQESLNNFEELVKKPHSKKALWWVIGIAAVIVVAFIVLSSMASATVTITPRQQIVELDNRITAHKDTNTESILGYQVMGLEAEASALVPASGTKNVERAASGKLTVYNDHDSSPLKLVARTRFQSPGGNIYRVRNAITVPGQKTVNGEVVPGELEITVFADETGSDKNVVANTKFSVPGLAGGPRAKTVYAVATTDIDGGFEGEMSVVSDEDLAAARTQLEQLLTDQLLEQARTQAPDGYYFFDEGYTVDYDFDEFASGEEESAENSRVSMTAKFDGVLFDAEQLSEYLARRELPTFSDAQVLIANLDELQFELDDPRAIIEEERVTFSLSGKTHFIWQFDEEGIKAALAGEKKSEHGKVFVDYPAIDRAEVSLWPFWRRSFPNKTGKIDIVVAEPKEE